MRVNAKMKQGIMMTFEEITALAKIGETPKYINDTDYLVLECLKDRILRYKLGRISAEELSLEHKRLKERHARIEAMRQIIKDTDQIRVALAGYNKRAVAEQNPLAMEIFQVLDGRAHG